MTKEHIELLKKLHKLVWKHDDLPTQEVLIDLQNLVGKELRKAEEEGSVELTRLDNGFIKNIKVLGG